MRWKSGCCLPFGCGLLLMFSLVITGCVQAAAEPLPRPAEDLVQQSELDSFVAELKSLNETAVKSSDTETKQVELLEKILAEISSMKQSQEALAKATLPDVELLYFGRKDCIYCPAALAVAQKVAKDSGVTLKQYDTDVDRDVSVRMGISAVPRVVVMRDGKEVKRFAGPINEQSLSSLVSESLEVSFSAPAEPVRDFARTYQTSYEPVRMQWNFEGDWNPSYNDMVDHMDDDHGVDVEGMSAAEIAALHDSLHNGAKTFRTVQYRGGGLSGMVRSICPGGNCPGGNCPL